MTDTSSGTIDLTGVVSSMQSTFVTWANTAVFAGLLTVPGMQWIGLPVVSYIVKAAINAAIAWLAESAMMAAFFLNTAVRKASQAQDYADAVSNKNGLPPTATPEEFKNAEQAEMDAFHRFVLFTN